MQNEKFPMSQEATLKLELKVILQELADSSVRLESATVPAYSVENRFELKDDSGELYCFTDDRTQVGDTHSFRVLVREICNKIRSGDGASTY